jgi:diaminohydroxyphosphoribosylaminopyrimidine deaminase/5-amino-6-(5-phosphoribosylamino)uracil reductase
MYDPALDIQYMQRALAVAERGVGFVSPNPLVGCVIVKDHDIVGEGYHERYGGPHAEINALRATRSDIRGATLYVTLEPCCHTGKTPPCVEALLQTGLSRVVVALRDPNPKVDGGGLARLRAAGIDVTVGVCEDEARRLNETFLHYIQTQRPFVTLKCAITLDGKIATRTGASRWITGGAARERVHRMRHAADALMVGVGTALQDDPQLTTRLPGGGGVNPLRIVVDSMLRLPLSSQLASVTQDCRTLVATSERAPVDKQRQLEDQGVEILRLPSYPDERVDIQALLMALGAREIADLLVEGGAALSATLFQRRLADKAVVFVAPKIIGGDGINVVAAFGVETMADALQLYGMTSQSVGEDVMLEAYLKPPELLLEHAPGRSEEA